MSSQMTNNNVRNLNDICRGLVEDVDYALAAAVVDQETGLLLGVSHTVHYFTQSYLDTVAAAAVEMFRGKAVNTIEKLIAELRATEPKHLTQEIQLTTADTYHFMTVVPNKTNILAVLVTSKKISLGMGWASLRGRLKEIADACP